MSGDVAFFRTSFTRDVISGIVVFLVALPLCLGVALASNAPLFSGILAGIVGGVLVGCLSGSHTSVSGPAAGLTAVVASQIESVGSFQSFLLALVVAGVIQFLMGILRAGNIAAFFPSSVIKGLLAAIGVILIMKQIPHLVGHDSDPEGDMAFQQPDHENTISELCAMAGDLHLGVMIVGFASLLLLLLWDRIKPLKRSIVPGPLVVVILGVTLGQLLEYFGGNYVITDSHMVQVPVAGSFSGFLNFLQGPDFSQWLNPKIYVAGLVIAIVASLETLLNLEAVDKLDPWKRRSPPNRELAAQGIGNLAAGMVGGIPITSVIIRSSVNINAGARSRTSTIVHGLLLFTSVLLIPTWLNRIPLSCLAAILLVTGIKLASPKLVVQMWRAGWDQFLPFIGTVIAIVLTDLLIGILFGLVLSVFFILRSNLRVPLRQVMERHVGGDVLRIELASQVSFLNRAVLSRVLNSVPRGGHVLLDARGTDYIDADVLGLIQEFQNEVAPAHEVKVSCLGFKPIYGQENCIQYVDFASQEVQETLTPHRVLELLREGNERFRSGHRLTRDLTRQVGSTAAGQFPLAVILSCIDSRTPAELIFDLGLGDIFSVRIAGNVARQKVLGSIEFGCAVAGAKLVLVLGHTRCGAVNTAVKLKLLGRSVQEETRCENLQPIIEEIQASIDEVRLVKIRNTPTESQEALINEVAWRNVEHTIHQIRANSRLLNQLECDGRIVIVGGLYDVMTGAVEIQTTVAESFAATLVAVS